MTRAEFQAVLMAHFRPIVLPSSDGVRTAGWAVEKSENGRRVGLVSHLYTRKSEATAEADKLNAVETAIRSELKGAKK
jgi:hypothetical protein